MKVATWNVNSVRARANRVDEWLDSTAPDVVLVQETKCSDVNFDPAVFNRHGYEVAHWGTGGYNGVAIASRVGLTDVSCGFGKGDERLAALGEREGWPHRWVREPRIIAATTAGLRVVSVYVPNGRELDDPHYAYKLAWLDELATLLGDASSAPATVVGGDFNVAPADIDCWNPKGWVGRTHVSQPERDRIGALATAGWVDLYRAHHDGPAFTWWNYRGAGFAKAQGLRIDLLLADPGTAARVEDVTVDLDERAREKPSDHAPVITTLTD